MHIELREITRADLVAQREYFKNAPREFLEMMGVDPEAVANLPPIDFEAYEKRQALPYLKRQSYGLAGYANGELIGIAHLVIEEREKVGQMHTHIFNPRNRHRGFGSEVFREVVQRFFELFNLELLYCIPSETNPAINSFLQKQGLKIVSTYDQPAAGMLRSRTVNRYEMRRFRDADCAGPQNYSQE